MRRKYELTDEVIEYEGKKLHRIRSLIHMPFVEVGDLGGFVESELNLSHDGDCWIFGNAKVMDGSKVIDHAMVKGNTIIKDYSTIAEMATVCDDSLITHYSIVRGHSSVLNQAKIISGYIDGYARIKHNAIVINSEISGKIIISGDTVIGSNGDYIEFKNLYEIPNTPIVWTKSNDKWSTPFKYGTAEEVLEFYSKRRPKDRYYLLKGYIELVEKIKKIQKRYG